MSAFAGKRRTGPGQERCVWPEARDSNSWGDRIMRYELADYEWLAIKPMLPNKPRGVSSGKRPSCPQWHRLRHITVDLPGNCSRA
jgi:hypothetical protein